MEALALKQPRRFAARTTLIAVVATAVAVAAYGASLIPGTLGTERTQPASLGALKHKTVFAIGDSAADELRRSPACWTRASRRA